MSDLLTADSKEDGTRRTAKRKEQVVTRLIARVTGVIFMVVVSAMVSWSAEEQQIDKGAGETQREPMYQGEPLSYWLRSIRDRDEKMLLAFDAIMGLGPDAWPAVEELTRIVGEPFTPVRIGLDRDDVIAPKLLSIHLRADAIDALTAIGEAAASSAAPLIQWALTVRVIPMNLDNVKDDELFVDLITLDVLERMRVAGAVARFGPAAAPAIVALLKSPDDEKRKLGVAILSENALPLAAQLLKSRHCEDRKRGIAILADMWPVVAKEHLTELRAALVCDAD
jgi:hypothetical protein